MKVTTINQLTHVSILLERDEALKALKDPHELQREIRKALGDVADIPLLGYRIARKRAVPKGKHRRGAGQQHGAARASTTTSCPQCGKEVKTRGLGIHMARKHKGSSAPAAGD